MRIINVTRNTVLADNAVVADRLLARIVGLLNKKELKPGEGLILKPCTSIHTLFMRFAIDALFVDKNNQIIKAIPHLGPFRFTHPYFNAALTIELPCGTIESTSTQEGDTLKMSNL